MDYYAIEPFGWEADCYSAGIVAATIANIHRDSKKKHDPFTAADFIPGYIKPKKDPRKTAAELAMVFASMKANQNAKRGGKGAGPKGAGTEPNKTRRTSRQGSGVGRAKGGGKANRGRGQAPRPGKDRPPA
jgi:hypothetical protein